MVRALAAVISQGMNAPETVKALSIYGVSIYGVGVEWRLLKREVPDGIEEGWINK